MKYCEVKNLSWYVSGTHRVLYSVKVLCGNVNHPRVSMPKKWHKIRAFGM